MKLKIVHIVIITSIIIVAALATSWFYFIKNKYTEDIPYNENIATQNISLPDGNEITSQAIANKHQTHGKIGAQLTNLTPLIKKNLHYPDQDGVYVQDTIRNSPAQTAGILPGDIIIKISNIETPDIFPTINLISSLHPGETYPITVFRQGKYLVYPVTLTQDLHS